jgi:cyclic pyranopterin phosphate synthase
MRATQPPPPAQLQEAGLNALNISLDTLRPDRFEALTRRAGHGKVLASIEEALRLGFAPLKVRLWRAGRARAAAA